MPGVDEPKHFLHDLVGKRQLKNAWTRVYSTWRWPLKPTSKATFELEDMRHFPGVLANVQYKQNASIPRALNSCGSQHLHQFMHSRHEQAAIACSWETSPEEAKLRLGSTSTIEQFLCTDCYDERQEPEQELARAPEYQQPAFHVLRASLRRRLRLNNKAPFWNDQHSLNRVLGLRPHKHAFGWLSRMFKRQELPKAILMVMKYGLIRVLQKAERPISPWVSDLGTLGWLKLGKSEPLPDVFIALLKTQGFAQVLFSYWNVAPRFILEIQYSIYLVGYQGRYYVPVLKSNTGYDYDGGNGRLRDITREPELFFRALNGAMAVHIIAPEMYTDSEKVYKEVVGQR